ncbi:MAG: DNA translocase FtsK 4TM domain-containing protein [Patescibacteria group bacterium UBA2103]
MARKRKRGRPRKDEREFGSVIPPIVFAIASLAVGGFFAIAAIGAAGPAGEAVYGLGTTLLGHGYILIPLAFLSLGALLFTSWKEEIPIGSSVGGVLLIASLLSLIALTPLDSGLVGSLISGGLASLFGVAGATLFLIAFSLIGAILLFRFEFSFDNSLPSFKMSSFFGKKEKDVHVEAYGDDEEEEDEFEEEEEEVEEDEEEEKEPSVNVFTDNDGDGESDEDPTIKTFGAYNAPPVDLLGKDKGKPGVGDIKANANLIKRTFSNFGIDVEMDEVSIGPTVTRYAIKPAEGVRLSKILSLQNNLELALAAHPVRIEAPIPGKSLVGIEVPNTSKAMVGLAGLLTSSQWKSSDKPLLSAVGRDITGEPHYVNVAKMPHGLIAGATGSGKSVAIHTLIASLLYRNGPDEMRFIMVDPKRVELTLYNGIPHLLTPVITDPKKAILALKWAAKEMDRRYNVLEQVGCRDINSYHEVAKEKEDAETMPYIVVVVDELADIMQAYPRELEAGIVRLAQMSRAVGIHLVLSTQRPSVNVVTGLIKANVPSRMALQVASQIDSKTILDMGGAEKLLGAGDMLFLSGDMSKPIRLQTAFISESEVKKVVAYIKKHNAGDTSNIDFAAPSGNGSHEGNDAMMSIDDDEDEDELYGEAKACVEAAGKASTSYLQRKLRVGYARAARLMDILEDKGVIGPADGSKPREVLTRGADDGYEDEEYEEER